MGTQWAVCAFPVLTLGAELSPLVPSGSLWFPLISALAVVVNLKPQVIVILS